MQSVEKKIEKILKFIKKNFDEHNLEWCKNQENVDEFGDFTSYTNFYNFQKIVLGELRESYLDMLLCLMCVKPSICDLESSYSRESDGFYFNQMKELVIFHHR
jgi:hypothetical protein